MNENEIVLFSTAIAFLASFLWMRHIYNLDVHKKEDKGLLAKAFIFGTIVTIPAGYINSFFGANYGYIVMFLTVGFTEEILKYLAVRHSAFKHPTFDEPIDGVIFASAAALGFAFAENIEYNFSIIMTSTMVTDDLLVRGITPFLHVLLSAIWGVQMGLIKTGRSSSKMALPLSVFIAAGIHSAYDLFGAPMIIALPFLSYYFYRKVKELNAISPYKIQHKYCVNCGKEMMEHYDFCTDCGYRK